jgi:hypothetical protein
MATLDLVQNANYWAINALQLGAHVQSDSLEDMSYEVHFSMHRDRVRVCRSTLKPYKFFLKYVPSHLS